ncbi:hypothetical protein [Streptomyces sp. NBC_01205]|uniref:hypothetical protein n=1 Tax=Streptomyces sp. NBC_01205 TaxID=2903771 RepID=UPI002E1450B5|nr:hypothetical protein OG573_43270 [Streptomyces sp. NBC_01205]
MLTDVLTGWTSETLGGLTLLTAAAVWGWLRRHRAARPDSATARVPAAAMPVRTYTLIGTRAPDGHPGQLVSTRPAGTIVNQRGPAGRERFELTDAVLSDGTYVAEPLNRHR